MKLFNKTYYKNCTRKHFAYLKIFWKETNIIIYTLCIELCIDAIFIRTCAQNLTPIWFMYGKLHNILKLIILFDITNSVIK